jgi:hypothetical protein
MTYFAYVHARPETVNQSGIFYVGKGKNGRSHDLNERNRYHGFIVDKYGKENILIGKMDCSTEEIAFELEKGLIKCLRRSGVEITNQTEGGDGSSGFKQSEETKRKHSIAAKALNARPEIKQSKSEATTKLNYERWADPVWAAKVSAAMVGKPKTRSEASDAARRANAQKASTPEANAKKSEASKRMWAERKRKSLSNIKE